MSIAFLTCFIALMLLA